MSRLQRLHEYEWRSALRNMWGMIWPIALLVGFSGEGVGVVGDRSGEAFGDSDPLCGAFCVGTCMRSCSVCVVALVSLSAIIEQDGGWKQSLFSPILIDHWSLQAGRQ